jgi:hypothetical protein
MIHTSIVDGLLKSIRIPTQYPIPISHSVRVFLVDR